MSSNETPSSSSRGLLSQPPSTHPVLSKEDKALLREAQLYIRNGAAQGALVGFLTGFVGYAQYRYVTLQIASPGSKVGWTKVFHPSANKYLWGCSLLASSVGSILGVYVGREKGRAKLLEVIMRHKMPVEEDRPFPPVAELKKYDRSYSTPSLGGAAGHERYRKTHGTGDQEQHPKLWAPEGRTLGTRDGSDYEFERAMGESHARRAKAIEDSRRRGEANAEPPPSGSAFKF